VDSDFLTKRSQAVEPDGLITEDDGPKKSARIALQRRGGRSRGQEKKSRTRTAVLASRREKAHSAFSQPGGGAQPQRELEHDSALSSQMVRVDMSHALACPARRSNASESRVTVTDVDRGCDLCSHSRKNPRV